MNRNEGNSGGASGPGNSRALKITLNSPEGELIECWSREEENFIVAYKPRLEEQGYSILGVSYDDRIEGLPRLVEVIGLESPSLAASGKKAGGKGKPARNTMARMAKARLREVLSNEEESTDEGEKPTSRKKPKVRNTKARMAMARLREVLKDKDGKPLSKSVKSDESTENGTEETETVFPKEDIRKPSEPPSPKNAADFPHDEPKPVDTDDFLSSGGSSENEPQAKPRAPRPEPPGETPAPPRRDPAKSPDERASRHSALGRGIKEETFQKLMSYSRKGESRFGPLLSPFVLLVSFVLWARIYSNEVRAVFARGGLAFPLVLLLGVSGAVELQVWGTLHRPEIFAYLDLSPLTAVFPLSALFFDGLSETAAAGIDVLATLLFFTVFFHVVLSLVGYQQNLPVALLAVSFARLAYLLTIGGLAYFAGEWSSFSRILLVAGLGSLACLKLARAFSHFLDERRFILTLALFFLHLMLSAGMIGEGQSWAGLSDMFREDDKESHRLGAVSLVLGLVQSETGRKLIAMAADGRTRGGGRLDLRDMDAYLALAERRNPSDSREFLKAIHGGPGAVSEKDAQDLIDAVKNGLDAGIGEVGGETAGAEDAIPEPAEGRTEEKSLPKDEAKSADVSETAENSKGSASPAPLKAGVRVVGPDEGGAGRPMTYRLDCCRVEPDPEEGDPSAGFVVQWDFTHDGETFRPDAEGGLYESARQVWPAKGRYTVAARLKDLQGRTAPIAVRQVRIRETPPVAIPEHALFLSPDGEKTRLRAALERETLKKGTVLEFDLHYDGAAFRPEYRADETGALSVSLKKPGMVRGAVRGQSVSGNIGPAAEFRLAVGEQAMKKAVRRQGPFTEGRDAALWAMPESGQDARYQWCFSCKKGTFRIEAESRDPFVSHVFPKSGRHTVFYRVASGKGKTGRPVAVQVEVADAPPTALVSETSTRQDRLQRVVRLKGTCSDPDKSDKILKYQWDTDFDGKSFLIRSEGPERGEVRVKRPERGLRRVALRCLGAGKKLSEIDVFTLYACPEEPR